MTQPTPDQLAAELDASRAPFLDHLEELRWRLWRALLGVIVAGIFCAFFYKEIFAFLTAPLFLPAAGATTAISPPPFNPLIMPPPGFPMGYFTFPCQ